VETGQFVNPQGCIENKWPPQGTPFPCSTSARGKDQTQNSYQLAQGHLTSRCQRKAEQNTLPLLSAPGPGCEGQGGVTIPSSLGGNALLRPKATQPWAAEQDHHTLDSSADNALHHLKHP
jgi:hypothetical protein